MRLKFRHIHIGLLASLLNFHKGHNAPLPSLLCKTHYTTTGAQSQRIFPKNLYDLCKIPENGDKIY
jgi:hypothetical protein